MAPHLTRRSCCTEGRCGGNTVQQVVFAISNSPIKLTRTAFPQSTDALSATRPTPHARGPWGAFCPGCRRIHPFRARTSRDTPALSTPGGSALMKGNLAEQKPAQKTTRAPPKFRAGAVFHPRAKERCKWPLSYAAATKYLTRGDHPRAQQSGRPADTSSPLSSKLEEPMAAGRPLCSAVARCDWVSYRERPCGAARSASRRRPRGPARSA